MSYYEHEIKVKIIDNLLSRSNEWEWFISYTEERFNPQISVKTFQEAQKCFNEVFDAFEFLCRIREYIDEDFSFTKEWLSELDQLALFYAGKLSIDAVQIKSDFAKVTLLLIYSGKIYNQTADEKYYLYCDIFKIRNLFTFVDVSLFVDEEETILSLFEAISIDLSAEIEIFKDNINRVELAADDNFIKLHKKELYKANCFNFSHVGSDIRTWEERELLNMLRVSYRDDKIIPIWSSGNSHSPMYELWTPPILKHISEYFNAECVDFITESIGFALHNSVPSEKTINRHFELLYELSNNIAKKDGYKISCSSLEFIASFFNCGKCRSMISKESYVFYTKVLNKIYELELYPILFKLKERNAIRDSKICGKLNDLISDKLDKICNISDCNEFLDFVRDERLYSRINNGYFEDLSEKFNTVIIDSDTMMSATVFLQYFILLLKIKNNKDINSFNVSQEMIRIRKMWQEEYYLKCCNSMTKVTTGSFTVPAGIKDTYVYSILSDPFNFASDLLKLSEEKLAECMMNVARNPLTLSVSKIIIAEDFPQKPFIKIDGKHPIDEFYLKEIEKQIQKNGYKFLNVFEPVKFASGIYDFIKNEFQIAMSLLDNVEPLYNIVREQNKEYQFIEFSEKPCLAHLTQLFPIVENKVRKIGELLGIVSVCESEEMCRRLKEPESILKTIISEVYDKGESLNIVPDLFFIHFCMFGENGLNIRNDCIHGNGYYTEQQINFAFKITLICLYIAGVRCQIMIDNLNELENKQDN